MLAVRYAVQAETDRLQLNCGGCGKQLFLTIDEIGRKFTIDCPECEKKRRDREAITFGGRSATTRARAGC